jgi:CheY-like chemotaxis protein
VDTLTEHFHTSTVVLVDGDADLRRYLACTMAALGASVHAFPAAPAAVEKIAQSDPDLVVFDAALPARELSEILAASRRPGIRGAAFLLALDAGARPAADLSALVDGCLRKPIDHALLLDVAATALAERATRPRHSGPGLPRSSGGRPLQSA